MSRVFKLTSIGKSYGSRDVLTDISLEIGPKTISAILGPNGSGKTTLLKIMALLIRPEEGEMELLGHGQVWERDKKSLLELRRRMAMVTQPVYMFQGSVFNNVSYGLRVRSCSSAEQSRRVRQSLEMVGMQDFIDYPARRLSAGEKQKVAIARALVLEPEVLFLDEPTANIDSASAIDIEKTIKSIREQIPEQHSNRDSQCFSSPPRGRPCLHAVGWRTNRIRPNGRAFQPPAGPANRGLYLRRSIFLETGLRRWWRQDGE